MQPILIAAGAIILFLLIWAVSTSNRLTHLQNIVKESWADIDVQLKRRYDLIPNLVETVKGYAAHEQATLTKVIDARNHILGSSNPAERAAGEQALVQSTNALFARAEAYPDLKASANFLELQSALGDTEDRIAAARRFYNSNVRDFNTALQTFPSSMFAGDRKPAEFFEIDELKVREPVQVSF